MEILMLDKRFEEKESTLLDWGMELIQRGHKIKVAKYLKELENYNQTLSNYDVAIAHPTEHDANLLYAEMQKRRDFRVVLNGGEIVAELDPEAVLRVRESPQCYYYELFGNKKDLADLIENGW